MNKLMSMVFIDDDKMTNVFHEIVVEKADVAESYRFFDSPVEALSFFNEQSNESNALLPEVIFLDINMPEMTGWEFLDKYELIDIQHSKVVILSTSLLPSDIQKSEEHKLVYKMINKPLDQTQLMQVAEGIMDLKG